MKQNKKSRFLRLKFSLYYVCKEIRKAESRLEFPYKIKRFWHWFGERRFLIKSGVTLSKSIVKFRYCREIFNSHSD